MFDKIVLCKDGLSLLPKIKNRNKHFDLYVQLVNTNDTPSTMIDMTYQKLQSLQIPEEFKSVSNYYKKSCALLIDQSPSMELSLIARGNPIEVSGQSAVCAKGHTIYLIARGDDKICHCLLGASESQEIISDKSLYLTISIEECNGQFIPLVDYDGFIPASIAYNNLTSETEAKENDFHSFPSKKVDVTNTYTNKESEVVYNAQHNKLEESFTTETAGVVYPKKAVVTFNGTTAVKDYENNGWVRCKCSLPYKKFLFTQNGKNYYLCNNSVTKDRDLVMSNDLEIFDCYMRTNGKVFITLDTFFRNNGFQYVDLNNGITLINKNNNVCTIRFVTPITTSNVQVHDLKVQYSTASGYKTDKINNTFCELLKMGYFFSGNNVFLSGVLSWARATGFILSDGPKDVKLTSSFNKDCESTTRTDKLAEGLAIVLTLDDTTTSVCFTMDTPNPYEMDRFDILLKNNYVNGDLEHYVTTGDVKIGTSYDTDILTITDSNASKTKVVSKAEVTEINNIASIQDTLYLDGNHIDPINIVVNSGEGASLGTRKKHLHAVHSNIFQGGQVFSKIIQVGNHIRPKSRGSQSIGTITYQFKDIYVENVNVHTGYNNKYYTLSGEYGKGVTISDSLLPTKSKDDILIYGDGIYNDKTLGSVSNTWGNVFTSCITFRTTQKINTNSRPVILGHVGFIEASYRASSFSEDLTNTKGVSCLETDVDFCPATEGTQSLGSKTTKWKNVYASEWIAYEDSPNKVSLFSDDSFDGLCVHGTLKPDTSSEDVPSCGYDLGTYNERFYHLFAKEINLGTNDSENITIKYENNKIVVNSDINPSIRNAYLGNNTSPWNTIYVKTLSFVDSSGTKTAKLNYYSDGIDVTGHLTPVSSDKYTLGNSSYKWSNLYVKSLSGSADAFASLIAPTTSAIGTMCLFWLKQTQASGASVVNKSRGDTVAGNMLYLATLQTSSIS